MALGGEQTILSERVGEEGSQRGVGYRQRLARAVIASGAGNHIGVLRGQQRLERG